MTDATIAQTDPILVAIDIAKARHEVLISVPGKKRRRRLTVLNRLEDFDRLIATLSDYNRPVRAAFEAKRAPDGSKRRRRGDRERMTVQDIPELRIFEQEVWDRVQDRLRASAEKTMGRNPRAAARKKYLLSELLECACGGQPYIMISTSSGGLYGCLGKRNGTCDNAQTIRRSRIEERVFAALTPALLSPEMEAAYQAAAAAERAKAKPQDAEAELKALRKAIKREEKARAAIFKAIEDGAPYAAFKARTEAIEATLTALQERYDTAESAQRAASQALPNVACSLSEALTVMHELLSDPDLVHEAHTLLATLINRIRLTPDDLAPHGIAAEIHTDLGRFLLADGQTSQTAPILATASLLAVKHGPMARDGALSSLCSSSKASSQA